MAGLGVHRCLEREKSGHPYIPKEVSIKKFFALALFGAVALFMALPAAADAAVYLGRYNGPGPRTIVIGRGPRVIGPGPRTIVIGRVPRNLDSWYAPNYYRGWGGAGYYSGNYNQPHATNYLAATTSYTAYCQPVPPVDVNAVMVRMHVPSRARVWFDGEATSQTGAARDYVSPALTPGHNYVYHIRVQWDENNEVVERQRDVTVHAGDRLDLNFDE